MFNIRNVFLQIRKDTRSQSEIKFLKMFSSKTKESLILKGWSGFSYFAMNSYVGSFLLLAVLLSHNPFLFKAGRKNRALPHAQALLYVSAYLIINGINWLLNGAFFVAGTRILLLDALSTFFGRFLILAAY